MTRKEMTDQIHLMVARGKERGFLTYDELAAYLPPDAVCEERLEDVVIKLQECNIEVIDDAASPKDQADDADEVHHEDISGGKNGFEEAPDDQMEDPLGRYLHEMAAERLLTRDEEVETAQQIEAGEQDLLDALLRAPYTINEVVSLGKKLRPVR